MEYEIEIPFQKEGGPYKVTMNHFFEENGIEQNQLSLYEKNVLINQEYGGKHG